MENTGTARLDHILQAVEDLAQSMRALWRIGGHQH
jgi:uncharacterized protein YoxC